MDDPLRTIVVGVGQLDGPDPHLATASRLATEQNARLYAVRAFRLPDPLVAAYPEVATYDPEVARAAEQAVLRRLQDQVAGLGGKGIECRTMAGPADTAIVGLAKEVEADLIVVGATERGGLSRAVLGTTAGRVIRTASAPVLINRRADDRGLRRVLMTTDLSELSGRVHQLGTRLASLLGDADEDIRTLLVLDEDLATLATGAADFVEKVENSELAPFLAQWSPGGVEIAGRVRLGDPAEEILAEIEEWNADLVVVGTHGRSGLSRILIGSVAEAVARRAACDVLVIPRTTFAMDATESELNE